MDGEEAIETAPDTEVADDAASDTPPEESLSAEDNGQVGAESDGAEPNQDDQTGESDEESQSEETEPEPKQSRADRRFAELTAKLHGKDEEIAKLKARVEAIDAEAVRDVAVPVDYFEPHEVKAIKAANEALDRESFLLEHIGTGYEHPTDPSKNLTTKQIGAELSALRRNYDQHLNARALYQQRQAEFVCHARLGRQVESQRKAKPAPAAAKPKPAVSAVRPSGPASAPVSRAAQVSGPDVKRFEANAKKLGAAEARRMELANLNTA